MNNPNLKNMLKTFGAITASVTTITGMHSYYLTVKNNTITEAYLESIKSEVLEAKADFSKFVQHEYDINDNLLKKVKNISERMNIVSSKMQDKSQEVLDESLKNRIINEVADLKKEWNTVGQNLREIIKDYETSKKNNFIKNGSSDNFLNNGSSDNIINAGSSDSIVNKSNNVINNLLSNNNNDKSLWENYYDFINNYGNWMQTLSLTKQSALIHITNSIFVLLCLLSLVTIYFSDSLIKYLKIEEKYPKLAKFLSIRRRFQQFYFFINALLIFIFSLLIIGFNILVFLYVD